VILYPAVVNEPLGGIVCGQPEKPPISQLSVILPAVAELTVELQDTVTEAFGLVFLMVRGVIILEPGTSLPKSICVTLLSNASTTCMYDTDVVIVADVGEFQSDVMAYAETTSALQTKIVRSSNVRFPSVLLNFISNHSHHAHVF
jgi:hypothetical protein